MPKIWNNTPPNFAGSFFKSPDLRGPTPTCPELLYSIDQPLPISALFGEIWTREGHPCSSYTSDKTSSYTAEFQKFTKKIRHIVKEYLIPLHLPDLAQEMVIRYSSYTLSEKTFQLTPQTLEILPLLYHHL